MIDKYVPDIYAQSIYRIDYESLINNGIKLIIFDLDNTIATVETKEPKEEAINLMFKLKELGLKPIIMSNSTKKRVEPFRNKLEIDSCANAMKPLKKNYKKILNMYRVSPEQVASVGDQLLTDIKGANKMGLTSILVNPISKKDGKFTILNRFIEKKLMFILEKRDLFKKGKYYE